MQTPFLVNVLKFAWISLAIIYVKQAETGGKTAISPLFCSKKADIRRISSGRYLSFVLLLLTWRHGYVFQSAVHHNKHLSALVSAERGAARSFTLLQEKQFELLSKHSCLSVCWLVASVCWLVCPLVGLSLFPLKERDKLSSTCSDRGGNL